MFFPYYCTIFYTLIIKAFGEPTNSVPEFISKPEVFRATNDGTITLPCQTKNLGPFILVWRKGTSLLSAGQLMVTQDKRFSLVNKYDLQLKHVQNSDQGDYICQIGDGTHGDLIHTIEILQSPKIQISPNNGHVTSRKGGQVMFECKATGNPLPEIRWVKKNGYLPTGQQTESGFVLTINNIERQHAGIYQCIADNKIGPAAMAEVQLHVLFPPEIEVSQTWISSGNTMSIKLDCAVRSDPPSQVLWYQNSFRIQTNDRRSMTRSGHSYSLTIRHLQANDFGNYTCSAENSLGKQKQFIEISGRPSTAKLSGIMYSDPTQYVIKWNVQTIFPIKEVRILYRRIMFNHTYQFPSQWQEILLKTEQNNDQYKLINLVPDSAYESMVQTRNQYGWSALSEIHQWFTNRWHQTSIQQETDGTYYHKLDNVTFYFLLISIVLNFYE